MADVTVASFEEMEPIYDGRARRARASLGVTSFGMQVMTLPGDWDGYPNHRHDASVEDASQRARSADRAPRAREPALGISANRR
jgi:hypothetical protein